MKQFEKVKFVFFRKNAGAGFRSFQSLGKLNLKILMPAVALGFVLFFPAYRGYARQQPQTEIEKKLQRRVSLDLKDMNVVDIYRFLAMKGDFNISISRNISGRVTLFMKDVSIGDALEIISIANELGYRIIGKNVVHVMTEPEYQSMFGQRFGDKRNLTITRLSYVRPEYVLETLRNVKSEIGKIVIDQESGSVVMIDTDDKIAEMKKAIAEIDRPLETRVYDLNYAEVSEVERKLRRKIEEKMVGAVQADARSNKLIVQAFPGRFQEIEKMIEALDERTRGVRIVARILKIIYNPEYEKGIEWPTVLTLNYESLNVEQKDFESLASTNIMDTYMAGNIDIEDFQVKLNLMDQVSETKVLANPTITVVQDREATIHIGDILAYVTTTTTGTGDDKTTTEEVHFLDVGVQLSVIPRISADDSITMRINPQISSQVGMLETPAGARIPLVDTTKVETEVIARDGETIILGGLRKDDIVKRTKRVPYLSSIPFLGNLFSNVSSQERNTEIAVLLTPHIIEEGDWLDLQEEERRIRPDREARAPAEKKVQQEVPYLRLRPDKTVKND